MKIRNFVRFSASLIAILTALPAFAQDGAEAEADEIIVTATRENTLLSKTPIAMSAVSGDSLISEGITDPTALGESVPNISIDRNNGLQITIRGVSSSDNTEKGDPSASFMLDGIYIARPQAQEVSFYDIERVEVLRGPQGTLFGRNTTAGLVNVITKAPRLGEFGASFDAAYGNYNAIQATGTINLPVGESVAIRGAVNFDKRDSYLLRGTSAFSLDPVKDNLSARLSALFQFSDRGKLVLRGDYSRQKGSASDYTNAVLASNFYALPFVNPAPGQAGTSPLYIGGNSSANALQTLGFNETQQASRDNHTWGIQGELNYELSDSLTINYLGSYRQFERKESFAIYNGSVFSGGSIVANVVAPATFDGTYKQNSQEVRLAYSTDRLKAQLGAYYFRENSGISLLVYGLQGAPGTRGFVFGFPQDPTISKSVAGFGQFTYSLTDKLRVTGGVRYTKDDKSRIGATIFHANVGDPLDYTTGVQPGTTNPNNRRDSANNAAVSYSKATWRAGLDYDLNDRTLLYATVSTGYKAGGFNGGCAAGTPNCNAPQDPSLLYYNPESITAYELGFKTRFADNAVRLNGNYFHYDYSNLQVTQVVPFQGAARQSTSNAGSAKIDGVELEATIKPGPNTTFDFAVNWLNARYSDYAIFEAQTIAGTAYPEVNFAGRKLDRSPEWTFSAGVTQVIPVGEGNITLNAQTRVSDEYFLLAGPMRAQVRQPGFTKSDISATYNAPGDRWYIQGFAKNLENAITVTTFNLNGAYPALQNGQVRLSDPRTYGIRAGLRF
jgi:iron complex outermembrane receptor protein